jgi:hypothetical protein
MKKLLLTTLLTVNCLLFTVTAQQNIGINATGAAPDPKALLDIDATGMATKGGLLIPRLTTVERNAITAPIPTSLLIYNTTTNCFEAWNQTATQWVPFGCITCTTPGAPVASAATGISTTGFLANWGAVAGANTYFIDVATNAAFTTFVPGYNNLNVGNSTALAVTGLTCGVNYRLRVRAANTCTTSSSVNSNTISTLTVACGGGTVICLPTGTNTAFGTFTTSCSGYSSTCAGTSFIDARDGTGYGSVQIANQCWMSSDLAIGAIGSPSNVIPQGSTVVPTSGPSNTNTSIEVINFPGNSYLGPEYYYTWNEAMAYGPSVGGSGIGPQGICPVGWHIPTVREWRCLEENAIFGYFFTKYAGFIQGGYPYFTFNSQLEPDVSLPTYASGSDYLVGAASTLLFINPPSGMIGGTNNFYGFNGTTGAGFFVYSAPFGVPSWGANFPGWWDYGAYLTSESSNPFVTNGLLYNGYGGMLFNTSPGPNGSGDDVASAVRCTKN